MSYKSIIKTYLFYLIVFLSLPIITIYVADPYMLFHPKWFHKGEIYNNLRIQNYGLIKYANFDSIIIGTSMLENSSANEASSKLASKFANLSISAGSLYERFKILDYAIKTRTFKHIIMSFDYPLNKLHRINETFNDNLYSKNSIKAKIDIYSTDKALECIFFNHNCDFMKFDLDRPKAWLARTRHARRFGGFQNWLKYADEDWQIKQAFEQLLDEQENYDYEASLYQQIIDQDLFPLLEHKDIRFSIIIPPYSALYWTKRKESLHTLLKPFRYLIEKTSHLPNVKIYWFYDEDYITDISKYKDLSHYHHLINSYQIDAIKNDTNIINLENYENKFADFSNKINSFNLDEYIGKIKQTSSNPYPH